MKRIYWTQEEGSGMFDMPGIFDILIVERLTPFLTPNIYYFPKFLIFSCDFLIEAKIWLENVPNL